MKKLTQIALLLSLSTLTAQVGIGTTDPKAELEIVSTKDGFLIPRVSLTSTNSLSVNPSVLINTPTASEMVYNTATINDVTPGYYYLKTDSGPWVRMVVSTDQININNVVANLSTNGINIPATTTSTYLQTGSYIDLPTGKYAVNVSVLMRTLGVGLTPNSSSFWVRTSFSEVSTANPQPSNDIVGGKLVSGSLSGSSYYGMVNGTVIVNNTSTATKRYYFIAGRVVVNSTTQTLEAFGGSSTDENRIIAYKIN